MAFNSLIADFILPFNYVVERPHEAHALCPFAQIYVQRPYTQKKARASYAETRVEKLTSGERLMLSVLTTPPKLFQNLSGGVRANSGGC